MLPLWNYSNHTIGNGGHENLNVLSHSHIATHMAFEYYSRCAMVLHVWRKKKKEKQRKSTLDYILVVLIYCTTATIIER